MGARDAHTAATVPVSAAPAFEEALAGARGWGLTRADMAFIAATVVAALAVWLALGLGYGVPSGSGSDGDAAAGSDSGGLVVVIQNTEGFYRVLPLDTDAEVTVEGSLGTNVFEVRGGQVRCSSSDCSNQVCTDTGWISSVGQMIVCLPHELTAQVVADPSDAVPLA